MLEIKNALISVYNKDNIISLAKVLEENGVKIYCTEGTFKYLNENGIHSIKISEYTGSEEMLDGRVKSLHPKIFAGILADKNNKEHLHQLKELGVEPIDLVVVNLYPFEEGLKKGLSVSEMTELIDIGGVALLRAGAKNYTNCCVLSSPEDYEHFINEIKLNGGISLPLRIELAVKTFFKTSRYDSIISGYISETGGIKQKVEMPEVLSIELMKVDELRYGENPHQKSSLYELTEDPYSIIKFEQLHGKKLSYNNYMDMDTAVTIVTEFEETACAIIKHAGPCGVGTGNNIYEAFNRAYTTDPISSFGGIIAVNRRLDYETANDISSSFFEVVMAPDFEPDALNTIQKRKNLRIIKMPIDKFPVKKYFKLYKIMGGLLLQEGDWEKDDPTKWDVVSDREPTETEWKSLIFANKVVKWVKSNGIVIASKNETIGIGGGQPSRVDSVEIAIKKAHNQGHYTGGTALASDGFFPFRDSIDVAQEAGVSAIVEPGGSIRDREVIDAANEFDIALVFTHKRHFRH